MPASKSLSQATCLPGGTAVRCTCSAGYALYPFVDALVDLFNYEEVIGFADKALYTAKERGRDQVVGVLGETGTIQAADREALKEDLAGGLESGQVRLVHSREV